MPKKIILLSDGTGNAAAKVWRTNVWRIFESLDLSGPTQVAFYDDGVGTSSFKPLAMLGGGFGWGLKRNVLDLYKFLCRNYKSNADYQADGTKSGDDEIFAFGFSRGAFTIRVVAGLVCDQGLVKYQTEEELAWKAKAAYRAYRAKKFKTRTKIEVPFRWLRNLFVPSKLKEYERQPVEAIRFLGLWDTVAAYGLPVDEMTRGISRYLFPLELPSRQLDPKVKHACHAVCLDDERTTFHPVLWDESKPAKDQKITQVWFAGVHSNVGGGYPDDSLAHVSLNWMLAEAGACDLKFKKTPDADPDAIVHAKAMQDKDGRLYDSRSGLAGYYRYGPRRLDNLCNAKYSNDPRDCCVLGPPIIHESVLERTKAGAHLYAPIGLPQEYRVMKRDGTVGAPGQNSYETKDRAAVRFEAQEHVWNMVWQKRAVYFLTVAASLHLLLYPLYEQLRPEHEQETRFRFVSDTIRLLGNFLPGFASRWIDDYARDPGWFMVSAGLVGGLIWLGARLGRKITDEMRLIWNNSLLGAPAHHTGPSRGVVKYLLIAGLFALAAYPSLEKLSLVQWIPEAIASYLRKFSGQPVQFVCMMTLIVWLLPRAFIRWLRTREAYKWTIRAFKYWILPLFFALAFLYLGFAFANHYIFNIRDGFGSYCRESEPGKRTKLANRNSQQVIDFDIGSYDKDGIAGSTTGKSRICLPTGLILERDVRYRVTLEREKPGDGWTLWGEPTHTAGVTFKKLPGWKRLAVFVLYPFIHSFDRPWGAVIMRYGPTGNEENFLDPDTEDAQYKATEKHEEILRRQKKDRELFVYLNKPMLAIPRLENWLADALGFKGRARITITRLN